MIERMTGTIQPYAWGSTIFIPELLGEQPDGDPKAELWLGAHTSSPSTVGGAALTDLIHDDPTGIVGAASAEAFGAKLPIC